MAKIILGYRQDWVGNTTNAVNTTYASSFFRELEALGHEVLEIGEGHQIKDVNKLGPMTINSFDLLIDLDCGRSTDGKLKFQNEGGNIKIPTAVWFIDSHGYPSLHHRMAKGYNHVFFAVWDKRDLFKSHPSAYWCPNATDVKWFNYNDFMDDYLDPDFTIGFFGSKGGLDRADVLKEICDRSEEHKLTYDIREIGRSWKVRWPKTAQAMVNCRILWNKGQKHDGPNQRVMESMIMRKPLITDRDPRDGMKQLFEEGEHFLGWETEAELGSQIRWCLTNKELAESMADRAYNEVLKKHLIKNRVEQILEICLQ
jgi:hypothetical protein